MSAGQLDCLLYVGNLVTLARRHQHVNRIGRGSSNVIIEIDIRDVERNVLLRVPGERFLEFIVSHLRQDDVLHDNRMPLNSSGYLWSLYLMLAKDLANHAR